MSGEGKLLGCTLGYRAQRVDLCITYTVRSLELARRKMRLRKTDGTPKVRRGVIDGGLPLSSSIGILPSGTFTPSSVSNILSTWISALRSRALVILSLGMSLKLMISKWITLLRISLLVQSRSAHSLLTWGTSGSIGT